MDRRRQNIVNFFHAWSAGSLLFFAGIILFSSAGRDDVFKSLWPAWTLSEFGQIVNYNGEVLEQSSSLLQVLLVGGLHRVLGGDIVLLGGLLAVLCGMGSVMFSQWLAQEVGLSTARMRWTTWLVAASSFVAYWSWGGLEASLAALCFLLFTVAVLRFVRRGGWPGFLLASAAFLLVRPENGFIAVFALGGLGIATWWRPSPHWSGRRIRTALLVVGGMAILLALVRWGAFGALVPHPVLAKAGSWGLGKVYRGAAYWFWQMWRHPEFLVLNLLFLAGIIAAMRRRALEKLWLPLALLLSAGAFVVFSGGDWMENGRFVVPMMPLFIVLTLALWERGGRRGVRWIPILFFLVEGFGLVHTARFHSTGQPLGYTTGRAKGGAGYSFFETANRIHMRDLLVCRALERTVGNIYREKQAPVTLLSQQAGMVIFHTAQAHFGRIDFMDLVALSTHDFLVCPVTRKRGATYGGLNMDLFYLFADRERLAAECDFVLPDIIFDLDNERREKELLLTANGYTLIYRQTGELRSWLPALPGLYVGAGQFIAVRDEWFARINFPFQEPLFE
ncbi:MAG: hypothetical protein AAGN35_15995 [Bacteroidota bacterium]